jgi:hypothetical protein
MSKIALKLQERSVTELIALATNIHAKMEDAPLIFVAPVISLLMLKDAIENLIAANIAAADRGKTAIQLRNTKAKILQGYLRQQAAYVEAITAGDPDLIIQSGMDLVRRGPRMYETVYPPENLVISYTRNNGELKLRWSRISNAKNYSVQFSLDPMAEDSWKEIRSCTKTSCIISGLDRGASLWFRVNAKAAAGVSSWSGSVMKIVP